MVWYRTGTRPILVLWSSLKIKIKIKGILQSSQYHIFLQLNLINALTFVNGEEFL